MNTKVITELELIENPILSKLIEFQCWNMLGIKFNRKIEWFIDVGTNNIIIKYI